MRVIDRYAKAVTSSHLESSDHATVDVDVLTAAGWAGRESLASVLTRARISPTPSSQRAAYQALERWVLGRKQLPDMARRLFSWLLEPYCPACRGLRFQIIHGTGHLSDHACTVCAGTGVRPQPSPTSKEAALQADIVRKLDRFERTMSRKLA
jgi:hypothetical protein